ncbi:oxidoreductase, short chain dehydrogenase/reductase family protein [Oceaniovalibus guishaninsula JLT2003]|uniref:Oxidoreductase, short chain dehydrogenase/reductase family protein n=1 Tax=Oceaniovalibus guishaninsula JLT2003 TaxID=1231392 RepID=K2I9N4_9RHOB|nr:SDR family oxidoreductase [Oceaniovalibus guishaninsula]EKE45645.1 oxidoreductase, short chain dehydrogenase/reductase family protein [Oceaniovalibus guishaninsula JLT2003]
MPRGMIVTGAGSGIGRAVASLALERGWRVGLLGRTRATLEETAAGRRDALVLPCDVTDEADVEAAFAQAAGAWGRIDAVFNNAGTGAPAAPIDEIALADWRRVCDVNITGAFLVARAAFGQMRRQDPQGGRIINNGSISAHVPRPGTAPYTMSKHAMTGLTRALSLDGRAYGIACGQIDIGNALTDMSAAFTRGVAQADGSVRAEPVMDVAHVATSVLYMAELPEGANVQFHTIMATAMPFIGRG